MTYLALLTSIILGRTSPDGEYFTPSGSSHGADYLFPNHISVPGVDEDYQTLPITISQWHSWYENALREYARDGFCVIRAGWDAASFDVWKEALESLSDPVIMISNPSTKLDWIYCWLNMTSKIPKHVYKTLQRRSRFYPKLWAADKIKILPRHVKIDEMVSAMPIHPILQDLHLNGALTFSPTQILSDQFLQNLIDFFADKNINITINDELTRYHRKFVGMQMPNYERASSIANGEFPTSRGPFDDILFRFLNNTDETNLEQGIPGCGP